MRTEARESLERILSAAGVRHERELPGKVQRTLRRLVERPHDPEMVDGLVELIEHAVCGGYVQALAEVDALGDTLVDVRELPEAEGPRP